MGEMPVRKKCKFMPGRFNPRPSGSVGFARLCRTAFLNALSWPHSPGTVVATKTGLIPSVYASLVAAAEECFEAPEVSEKWRAVQERERERDG